MIQAWPSESSWSLTFLVAWLIWLSAQPSSTPSSSHVYLQWLTCLGPLVFTQGSGSAIAFIPELATPYMNGTIATNILDNVRGVYLASARSVFYANHHWDWWVRYLDVSFRGGDQPAEKRGREVPFNWLRDCQVAATNGALPNNYHTYDV